MQHQLRAATTMTPTQLGNDTFDYGPLGLSLEEDEGDMMSMIDNSNFDFDGMPMGFDDAPESSSKDQTPTGMISQPPWLSRDDSLPMGAEAATSSEAPTGDENGPGAGPPPISTVGALTTTTTTMMAGAGQSGQASAPSSSTLTEFTKRRNWSAKVVEELRDLLQILDANGRIRHVSPSITHLTGYAPEDVLDRFLRDLVHPDDIGVFVSELNESIATGNMLRLFYRMKKKDGTYGVFEAVGHAHIAAAKFAPNPNNQSPFCQAVFMMSRLYPTTNAALIDSFLEHKIENERLKRKIAELRREEEEENEDLQGRSRHTDGRSESAMSEWTSPSTLQTATSGGFQALGASTMPPPERPGSLSTALTQKNLEDSIASNRPESMRDKMARSLPTQADTIEMLTGLRYQEGERSRGLTTGNTSPALIKGDAGIAIPVDRDPRTGETKKKQKLAEEYVCTDCGTLDSPEWRKGPSGPKTLCNACGLRWAKKEKKKGPRAEAGMVDSGLPGG